MSEDEGECDVGEDEGEMREVEGEGEGEIVERRSSAWVSPSLHVFVLISIKLIWCSVIFFLVLISHITNLVLSCLNLWCSKHTSSMNYCFCSNQTIVHYINEETKRAHR
jgi:hypothetical protein